jgi:magnesium transporter
MGREKGIRPESPVVALENGDSALQQKVDTTETTYCSFFSTQLDVIAHAPSIQSLKLSYPTFEALLETDTPAELWWLHLASPTDGDVETLSRMLDIHPLTTEDIKMREPREKTELFGPYYFVSLRSPKQLETVAGVRTSSLSVYAIVFRGGILSFSFGDSQHTQNVLGRIEEHRSHLPLTSDWICYALM